MHPPTKKGVLSILHQLVHFMNWNKSLNSNVDLISIDIFSLLLTETTDEESDYEIEYEVLSRGSDEPWEYVGVSGNELLSTSGEVGFVEEQITIRNCEVLKHEKFGEDKARVDIPISEAVAGASSSHSNSLASETVKTEEVCFASEAVGDNNQGKHDESRCESEVRENTRGNSDGDVESDEDSYYGHEDLERLMCEIGSMRANLRLMPDVQRREMAAKLAMKMASMFGESSDDDANFDQVEAWAFSISTTRECFKQCGEVCQPIWQKYYEECWKAATACLSGMGMGTDYELGEVLTVLQTQILHSLIWSSS